MKIGITTIFPGNHNYGGMLQAYALPQAIKQIWGDCLKTHSSQNVS